MVLYPDVWCYFASASSAVFAVFGVFGVWKLNIIFQL